MKYAISISIFILFSYLTDAQNIGQQGDTLLNYTDINGFKQGKWKKKYYSGKIKYEGYFVNDKPIGEFIRYFENGRVKAKLNYSKSNERVWAVFYDKLGPRIAEGRYINGLKDSIWRYYFNDTILLLEEKYVLGEKKGMVKKYYENGQLYDESYIYDGIRDSTWRQFYTDGTLKMECYHINGKRTGDIRVYSPDGKLEVKGQYENDLKEGKWYFYKDDGSIEQQYEFIKGIAKNQDELDKKEQEFFDEIEKDKGKVVDPDNYIENPEEYIMRMKKN